VNLLVIGSIAVSQLVYSDWWNG